MYFKKERIGEILRQLHPLCYKNSLEIRTFRGKEEHFSITDRWEKDTGNWEQVDPCVVGKGNGAYFALAFEVGISEEYQGSPVELHFSTGREGEWDATNPQIAAYVNGKLSQGLDVNHRNLLLTESAEKEEFSIVLLVYTGERGTISNWKCELREINRNVEKLYYDMLIPFQCLDLYEKDSREYELLLEVLNQTVNCLDMRRIADVSFYESVKKADAQLQNKIKKFPQNEVVASCIGHTHIDVAWLWTLAVTQEKAARSFSTVIKLMEEYPEYRFMSSQPQLYKYVKKNQPELYKKIQEKVKEGRWEPEGGMFLEADCNLVSGESMVRQFLYGKQFFREEFGKDCKILWLPDVFGYSAALPQIMEKCGIESFMTTKISWNEINKMPYDTFWWEGIDGTKILSYFVTTRDYSNQGVRIATSKEYTTEFSTNYNGEIHPSQIKGAWQRYQQKGQNENILISYGYGDGGGGPTEEMLETARRLRQGQFGCPAVRQEFAGEFFDRLHKTASVEKFPIWSGELYLEYHRGTYTSMAENKKNNRKGEFALQNAETWSVITKRELEEPYPVEQIHDCWEILMRNQFHDILPGSSIKEVYEDSRREYASLFFNTDKISEHALEKLTDKVSGKKSDVIVYNANGICVDGIVEIEDDIVDNSSISGMRCGEKVFPVQKTADNHFIFKAEKVPSKGWKKFIPVYDAFEGNLEQSDKKEDFYCTELKTVTPFYVMEWNEKGQITSIFDKRQKRELLQKQKCANVIMTYEDKPHQFDNWNIFEYYSEKQWAVENLVSRKIIENGPVRIVLELVYEYLGSRIAEYFYFYPDNPRFDIRMKIDWNEDQILMKLLFPVEMNTKEATFDIQYGNVRRNTMKNTSWDRARFEVCYQKWMDVSEYGYGVSFLSDSKYGVSICENEVGLTILKSGMYPSEIADRGKHELVFSVVPHIGGWQESGTISQAYELNNPLVGYVKQSDGGAFSENYSYVSSDKENIIVEVIKASEYGEAEIVRLYECWNKRTEAEIKFAVPVKRVALCNMLEEEEKEIQTDGRMCYVSFKPYEIITLKLLR